MTPEDIKKLPIPETKKFLDFYAHLPLGNMPEAIIEKMCSLEQRLAAAVIALEDLWKNSYYANAPTEMENAEETLASIRNMK